MRENLKLNIDNSGNKDRPIAVNDNFQSSYLNTLWDTPLYEVVKQNDVLVVLINFLALIDTESLIGEANPDVLELLKNKGLGVSTLSAHFLRFAGKPFECIINTDDTDDTRRFNIVIHDKPTHPEETIGFTIEPSLLFTLCEDAAFFVNRSNRSNGSLILFLRGCVLQQVALNLRDPRVVSGKRPLCFIHLEEKCAYLTDKALRKSWRFAYSIDFIGIAFEGDKDERHTAKGGPIELSPDFIEIYEEIRRRLDLHSYEPVTLSAPQFSIEKPYDFSYMSKLIESALSVLESKHVALRPDKAGRYSKIVDTFKAAKLDIQRSNYKDGDRFPEEYGGQVLNLFRSGLEYLKGYTIEDGKFVRNDETEIVPTDDPNTFGTEQSGEDDATGKITRFTADEKLLITKVRLPESRKAAMEIVAAEQTTSLNAIANMIFDGNEVVRRQVEEKRQMLMKALADAAQASSETLEAEKVRIIASLKPKN